MEEKFTLQLLNLNISRDIDSYNSALNTIKKNSPYHKISFIKTFSCSLENCRAFLLTDPNNQVVIVMPFHINSIDTKVNNIEYFDVTSTYGYGGPLYNDFVNEETLQTFWTLVNRWYANNNIVSEFIRFDLKGNYLGYNGYIKETMHNIVGQIDDVAVMHKNYDRKVRKNIKKAEREGITVKIYYNNITNEIIDAFYDVYIETMNRTKADSHFYFDKTKVINFITDCVENIAIAIAYYNNKPVSAELILCSNSDIYSFIGGTKSAYFNKRPNDLLKHHIITWAHKRGFKNFVLGGGHGIDDGIFKFKKTFFPNGVVSYFTGRKIVNEAVYTELTKTKFAIKNNLTLIMDSYFPIYNSPEIKDEGMIKEVRNKSDWNEILEAIGHYDFYHTYDYHSISINSNEAPVLITYIKDDVFIALPLVLRPINNTIYYDFTSVYGYAGPLTNATEDYDFSQFHEELIAYFNSKNIVSVFSRLHPYLNQQPIINTLGDIVNLGEVVNIDVTLPLEESRRAYSKSNKNQINKLRRQCDVVEAQTKEEILEFVDIYYENMKRLDAEDHYFFSEEYFLNFMEITDFKTDILLVRDKETNTFIAGSMFVKTRDIVQFHLSGTLSDFLRLKPSKLFLDEMRIKATQEGYKFFNLGGGLGAEHDSLFDFKASFSKDFRAFNIWKYIVNQEIYDELSQTKEDTGFFPKYRG